MGEPNTNTGQLDAANVDPAALAREHPADVAELIEGLAPEAGAEVLSALPPEAAADALEQMDQTAAEELIADMDSAAAADAVAHMAPDDAADLLAEVAEEKREEILEDLPSEQRAQIRELMSYPPESAGGIMSPEVTFLPADLSVPESIARLREMASEREQVYYTYVVDEQQRLVGVLSLRDLLFAGALQTLSDIMIRNVTSVPVDMDREEVARLLTKYGYVAIPVVDREERLVGIVTVDDVVDIIQEEATEDIQRMVGAGGDERLDSPVRLVLRRRVMWLLINLATAFLAAAVVGMFEGTLQKLVALAILMPIVAGQAGNTGLQSMAVMVRGLAMGEERRIRLFTIFLREIWIGFAGGAVIGLACAGVTYAWWRDGALAGVIGLAMISCMVIATVSGAMIPLIMRRLGFDPAQSSSIILTTVTDIAGFGIFLALGTWLVSLMD